MIRKGISRKITLLFVLCMATALLICCILFNNVLINSVNNMENVYVQDSLSKIENTYKQELNDIAIRAQGWGLWDNMYDSLEQPSHQILEDGQMKAEFENLNLNMMLFTDISGNVLYGRMMDLDTEQMRDVDPEIISRLNFMDMLGNKDEQKTIKGILNLKNGPILIASGTVVTNGTNGKMMGNVFFGRYFDNMVLGNFSSQLNYNLSMSVLDAGAYRQLNVKEDASGNLIYISPKDENTILGSVTFPDIDHLSGVQVSVPLPRDIHRLGLNAFYFSMLIMVVLFGVSIVLLLFSISRIVLSRIAKLHGDVERVAENRSFSERVYVSRSSDEITSLAERVNGMLDVMEDLHETVRVQNDELEQTVRQRTQELTAANSELNREKEYIKHIAYHDKLTGLPNGTYLNDYLNYQVSFSTRTGDPLAVFFLDLDGFKSINDTLGHAAGDELLIQVANRLTRVLRKNDFTARIGGDEFVILVGSINRKDSVEVVAQKILETIVQPFIIAGQECFMSVSIGIAFCPQDGNNTQELLKNADMALYRAKSEGRNQVCYCSDELKDRIRDNMILSNQLWRALERNEFELYYQPQIACHTRRIVGVEALIRWNHPERGMVMPGQFISLAEQTGAIMPIGAWVLKQACIQCKDWHRRFGIPLRMAVNVSIKQLQTLDIIGQVQDVLDETGLNPGSLELEITESVMLREVSIVLVVLNRLKTLGLQISIDDFGTEYASFNYLKHMPVDRIKIAMPFVQGLDDSEKDKAITKSLIILAKNMGLSVIAEGVETESQFDFLTNRLCDETQGFYLYRPMRAAEFENLICAIRK